MSDELKLPVQADIDERDMKRVVFATYVYAGLITVGVVLGALGLGVSILSGVSGGLGGVLISTFSLVFAALYAYANVRSAQAITARQDLHFCFFVAGLNCMGFPIGTLYSMYFWQVMGRPSVRESFGVGQLSAPLTAGAPKPVAPPKPRLKVVPDASEHSDLEAPNMTFHEAMAHAEQQEEQMWRQLEEQHKQEQNKRDKEASGASE